MPLPPPPAVGGFTASPPPPAPSEIQTIEVRAHNEKRALHQATGNLTWDTALASAAQGWAEGCAVWWHEVQSLHVGLIRRVPHTLPLAHTWPFSRETAVALSAQQRITAGLLRGGLRHAGLN